jgi:hypothetical protein
MQSLNTMKMNSLVLALSLALAWPAAHADEREQLETLRATTLAILDALVAKGVLTEDAAKALLKDAGEKAQAQVAANAATESAAAATSAKVVRVPYIPETVKREIREQIRQEVVAQAKTERWGDVNAVPEWLDRLKWSGDIRLRAQGDYFAGGNASGFNFIDEPYGLGSLANPLNTDTDRQRLRLRARLMLDAKITDDVAAGFRISSGNLTEPYSTNQTLGTGFNKYSLVLDQAFVKAQPWDWLTLSGGRMP